MTSATCDLLSISVISCTFATLTIVVIIVDTLVLFRNLVVITVDSHFSCRRPRIRDNNSLNPEARGRGRTPIASTVYPELHTIIHISWASVYRSSLTSFT